MADKRHIKRSIKQLQRVKTWQLIILLILVGFIAATFLRLNNIGMVQRRDAVLAADSTGNAEMITQQLSDLQRYSADHMNASTGQFYLENEYTQAVKATVNQGTSYNDKIGDEYRSVDKHCKSLYSVYSQAWVQCYYDGLKALGSAPSPTESTQLPDPGIYRYSFIAPLWSPDFAGFSTLAAGVIVLMIISRLISLGILRMLLHRHYRGV